MSSEYGSFQLAFSWRGFVCFFSWLFWKAFNPTAGFSFPLPSQKPLILYIVVPVKIMEYSTSINGSNLLVASITVVL